VRAVQDRQTDNLGTMPRTATSVCIIGRFWGTLAHQNEIRPHHCVSFCSQKVKHWIAAVLKQKCAKMHQFLFQFQFFRGRHPRTPATRALPQPPGEGGAGVGRKGSEGRERAGRGKGRGKGEAGGREEEGKFASLPLGDRRPCPQRT